MKQEINNSTFGKQSIVYPHFVFLFFATSCADNHNSQLDSDTVAAGTYTDSDYASDSHTDSDSETDSVTISDSASDLDTNFDTQSDSTSGTDTDSASADQCIHPPVEASCTDGWCTIPHGCFLYGAPPEEPCGVPDLEKQTEVVLTHDFVIAQTEVTQAQWNSMGFNNPMSSDMICSDCPIGYVNWYDALAYCNALSIKEGLEPCYNLSGCEGVAGEGCPDRLFFGCSEGTYKCEYMVNRFENHYKCPGYRLPTSAEWQYAARAGTKTATYNGDLPSDLRKCEPQPILDLIAWHCGNTEKAMPVAQKLPNAWGLYDMLGNIYELLSDNYDGYSIGHGASRVIDPQGILLSSWAMRNGGSWWLEICYNRSGATTAAPKDERWINWGFRPVRTLTFSEPDTDKVDTETELTTDTATDYETASDTSSETIADAGANDQCIGRGDFAFCSSESIDRYGIDYSYDICIDESCVTIGACDDTFCNVSGQYFPAPPISGSDRFSINTQIVDEAVVFDSLTGLFWQGMVPETFDGCTAGPIDGVREAECRWWQAFAYCNTLNYGGFTDWYLPDEHELLSIIDFGFTQPSIDAAVFPDTPTDTFWTSSSKDIEYAWLVSMDIGRVDYWYKDLGALVRCVRREPAEILNRFERTESSPGEPAVTDAATGLTWQGCAAGQIGDETDCVGAELLLEGGEGDNSATSYCEALNWGGFSDWRLPNIKELTSLANLRNEGTTALDETAFPFVPENWIWSSTPYAPYPDHSWFLDVTTGRINVADNTYGHTVLCVR